MLNCVLQPPLELLDNLLVVWKIPGLELGIDQFAVQQYFKTAFIGRDELQRTEFLAECIHDGFRQAHGLRDIVSSHAILDGDLSFILCHPARPP